MLLLQSKQLKKHSFHCQQRYNLHFRVKKHKALAFRVMFDSNTYRCGLKEVVKELKL